MKLFLVEDEDSILEILKYNLEENGHTVTTARNGTDALKIAEAQHFDMILLDLMLPELDGFSVLQSIRMMERNQAIIVISAREEAADRIKALKLGADDYMVKPIAVDELELRMRNVLLRTTTVPTERDSFVFGTNKVNFKTFEAIGVNGPFIMTKKEAHLIKLLIDHEGEVVSREMILQFVWGYDVFPTTRTVDNFVLSFRKQFEQDSRNPIYLHTVRAVGYKFTNPDK
jgi:two-component system, OmpR family, alkaline phosphatase synthesis response regulator PhoP